jgi:CRP-like cAMP-binding protein
MDTTCAELEEVVEALRLTELFEILSESMVRNTAAAGCTSELRRGEYLFHTSEPSDCIHLLLDGAIEIVRSTAESPQPVPVAYITPGEMIGDMALFTRSPRRSDGRVPEYARVWTLTRGDFDRLSREIPDYGMELTRVFARRLQDMITHIRRQARRKELAGKLKYFDMPTVVQTLVNAGQTGLLAMVHDAQDIFAQVVLQAGQVQRARFGDLEGEEAFFEIFLHREDGEFYFRSLVDADPELISSQTIAQPTVHLMMDAMRRADELADLQQQLRGDTQTYRVTSPELAWADSRTSTAATVIHRALQGGARLEDLRGKVGCSSFTLYRIAAQLVESGQLVRLDG